ncbi:hypothetical protein LXL04_033264 [Taraxacum kok-saghyz]
MQTGRGLPATRGYPTLTGRDLPALMGNGAGMGLKFGTRSGRGSGTGRLEERLHNSLLKFKCSTLLFHRNNIAIVSPSPINKISITNKIAIVSPSPNHEQHSSSTGKSDCRLPQPSHEAFATTNAQVAATTDVEVVDAATEVQGAAVDAQPAENTRRLTSPVWKHFVKRKIGEVDKAVCNYCGKKLSAKSKNGTKHLHEHYKNCMSRRNKDIKQAILNPRQEKKDGPISLNAHTFDQNVSREELANMIILHEYPLNMVEHVGFRRFVNSVNPLFKHVSRTTLKSDIKVIFESEKAKIKRVLNANKGRVAVTTDMWTASNQKRGYMVVTAHYIDDSWNLCNKILRFMYVPAPHNAKTLSKELMGCLVAWFMYVPAPLKYPTLQQVVRDILAIPVSTVASESAFSSGGRHVTPHRNRLHPDTLEALICAQDWLWDEKLGTHSNSEKHLAKFEVIKDVESTLFKWVSIGFPEPVGDFYTRTRRVFCGAGAGMGLGSVVGYGYGSFCPRHYPSPFASLNLTLARLNISMTSQLKRKRRY